MKKSSLIGHVCELVDLIRTSQSPADGIVRGFFRARHYLGSKDRRFISETLYSILRNFRFVQWIVYTVGSGSASADASSLAIYAAFAIKIQSESIESVLADVESSWRISFPATECRTFLEGVVRLDVPAHMERDPEKRVARRHSFPDSIVAEWFGRFGRDETEKLCAALNQPAPITIRVNVLRSTVMECQSRLETEGVSSHATQLSPAGLILSKRVNVQALQSFRDGLFEMQDEGSQLLSLLVAPEPGQVVVDACAGGGGKTLHLAALMKNSGVLHALDTDEKRLANIRPRLARAGVTVAQLARQTDAAVAALHGAADALLIDAPCSGIGTIRRNPGLKIRFNDEVSSRLSAVQRGLLETYAPVVKVGGRFVYTTCTLLRRENEDIVDSFLAAHPEFVPESASDTLGKSGIRLHPQMKYLTLLPHTSNTDGFFGAILRRMA